MSSQADRSAPGEQPSGGTATAGALGALRRILRALDLSLKALVVIALVFMVAFVFLNAFLRYVFHSGLTWSEEAARYLFVWVVFLGAIVATHERGHLAVDVLTARFAWLGRRIVLISSNIVFIAMLGFLIDGLLGLMTLNAGVPAPVTGIPRNTMYAAGLVSCVTIIAILVVQTVTLGFLGGLEKQVDRAEAALETVG